MTDGELRALVASNARAIQGNANAIAELRDGIAQQGTQMMQGISEVVAMVGELAIQQHNYRRSPIYL
ncbi:MAG: hypothetical protein AAF651_02335 [Cyanobacteria bacterium P01_C01_bin.73]